MWIICKHKNSFIERYLYWPSVQFILVYFIASGSDITIKLCSDHVSNNKHITFLFYSLYASISQSS